MVDNSDSDRIAKNVDDSTAAVEDPFHAEEDPNIQKKYASIFKNREKNLENYIFVNNFRKIKKMRETP